MSDSKLSNSELIAIEQARCKRDPVYFIQKYCIIQHPIKGKIPFNMFEFQKETIQHFLNNRYNIILKSRQLGISTLTSAYALWLAAFNDDKTILCIATKSDVAANIIKKIDLMIEKCPKWLLPKILKSNTSIKIFGNGSFIKSIPTSVDAGRSESLSLLILDEAAFIYDIDEIWSAASHTLETGGDCIALSTPNGVGNWFYKTYTDATSQLNDFNPIRLPWQVHPEHDEKWYEEQKRKDPEKYKQECDADFLSSGNSVVELYLLEEKYKPMISEPLYKDPQYLKLFIWEPPDISREYFYIICADVATGDGADYSAFNVIKISQKLNEKDKVVATFKDKIQTDKFGQLLNNVGLAYNTALIIVENNAVGIAPLQELTRLEYPNLYYTPNNQDYEYDFINNYEALERVKFDGRPGISTNGNTRPKVVSKLINNFYNETFEFYDQRIYDEVVTFVNINGKPQAAKGCNDDLVMSLSIGLWVRDIYFKIRAISTEKNIEVLNSYMKSDKVDKIEFQKINYNPGDAWKMQTSVNVVEDISWLVR